MPRGLPLTQLEMEKVQAFHKSVDSIRVISIKISFSPKTVRNFIELGENYGKKKSPGRPTKISERDC